MLKNLEKAASGIALFAAVAYVLGWVKVSSYFNSFGIGVSQLDLSIQNYLFESWYPIENLIFFVIFSWALQAAFRLKLPSRSLATTWYMLLTLLGVAYLMIPLATSATFAPGQARSWILSHYANWLERTYYSALKFTPFALYLLVLLIVALLVRYGFCKWDVLQEVFRVPFKHHMFVVYLAVAVGWSISAAKHFGEIDAKNIMNDPQASLSTVNLHLKDDDAELNAKLNSVNGQLYSLYVSEKNYFLWDHSGFNFCDGEPAKILVVSREKVAWLEATKKVQLKPGPLLFPNLGAPGAAKGAGHGCSNR